jgi:hypothetical protein
MITTCKLRTGTLVMPKSACICGERELTPAHALSCKKLRGRFVRHDVLVDLAHSMLKDAGVIACKEVMPIAGSSKRMDIVIYKADGTRIWIDVSVINPEMKSYVNQKRPAVEIREQAKIGKYGKLAKDRGIEFIPACIEVYGNTGSGIDRLLRIIATAACQSHPFQLNKSPANWEGLYRYALKKRFATTLALGNHIMIEEAVLKALPRGGSRMSQAERHRIIEKGYAQLWRKSSFYRSELRL